MINPLSKRQFIRIISLALGRFVLPFSFKTDVMQYKELTSQIFDVIIIGGSYAGLSAAMTLGRSLRQVLIIDANMPCNKQTPYSHNFITHDGERPAEIALKAKAEVSTYLTVSTIDDRATSANKLPNGYEVQVNSGKKFKGRKIIFATGIKDALPSISGFSECWGITVIHCPYCHGYEFRGKFTGIMANGDTAVHLASLVSNLTKNITLLTNGQATFTEMQKKKISNHNIKILESEVLEIDHKNGFIKNVIFKDGSKLLLDALYAAVPFMQHSTLPVDLGCGLSKNGYIEVDALHRTNIAGVYACGDNTASMRSVANAVASGNFTGAAVNKELCDEEF
jgi:thioredoxin reductase